MRYGLLFLSAIVLTGCGADFQARKAYYADLERKRDACKAQVGGEPFVANPGMALIVFGALGGALAGASQASAEQASPEWVAWHQGMTDCLAASQKSSLQATK